VLAGSWLYRAARPATYQPGEELAGITRSLAAAVPAAAPVPRLTDVTEAAGLSGFVQFAGARSAQLPEDMGSGVAWGDHDNDGDDDLFVVASGAALGAPPAARAPSLLFENRGDGTFVPAAGFPDLRLIGMGAAWGDYDGDGWLDLVVTAYGELVLLHNERGRLVREERFDGGAGFFAGASWGDYDRDGDLDLYVCGYVRYRPDDAGRARATLQYGQAVPYTLNPSSYPPEPNRLFRNDGDGRFEDVAARLGVANPEGRSLSALWHDFDQDGWLDLYVANDVSDNVFYHNRQGRFVEISHPAWVADHRGAMGLAAGDWNGDGDTDLFISHWLAQENALYDSQLRQIGAAPAGAPDVPVRFIDVADQVGLGQISLPMVGWGTEFADLDADGWLDLLVANGSTMEREDDPRQLQPQAPFLFWSRAGVAFHDLAPALEPFARPRVSRGLAVADYDRDGDLDVAIVNRDAGVTLWRNEMQTGNWIELRLRQRGRHAPGFGDGVSVAARAGARLLLRAVDGASYLSQSTRVVHLGLGEARGLDEVEVRWPDGTREVHGGLEGGVRWELIQGDPTAHRAPATAGAPPAGDRARVARFWELQRAAMEAMKRDRDAARAVELFGQALELDPRHEDSRYYLASCLVQLGRTDAAIAELEQLVAVQPQSHRGWTRLGSLRAASARDAAGLQAAERDLERAHRINLEETGALLILGEVALLRGDLAAAEQRLSLACRSNPRAVGGLFLRGYIAWRRGDRPGAVRLLRQARTALGPDWKPAGATAEGDVAARQHEQASPLAACWEAWDGTPAPETAFSDLGARLDRFPLRSAP